MCGVIHQRHIRAPWRSVLMISSGGAGRFSVARGHAHPAVGRHGVSCHRWVQRVRNTVSEVHRSKCRMRLKRSPYRAERRGYFASNPVSRRTGYTRKRSRKGSGSYFHLGRRGRRASSGMVGRVASIRMHRHITIDKCSRLPIIGAQHNRRRWSSPGMPTPG